MQTMFKLFFSCLLCLALSLVSGCDEEKTKPAGPGGERQQPYGDDGRYR